MASDDYIPTQPAAVSVRCEPCDRGVYYDSQELVWYLRSRGWVPTLPTVVERFRCSRCDAPPTVRIVQALRRTTALPGSRPVERWP